MFQEEKDFDVIQDEDHSGDEGGVEAETNMTLHGWVGCCLLNKMHSQIT